MPNHICASKSGRSQVTREPRRLQLGRSLSLIPLRRPVRCSNPYPCSPASRAAPPSPVKSTHNFAVDSLGTPRVLCGTQILIPLTCTSGCGLPPTLSQVLLPIVSPPTFHYNLFYSLVTAETTVRVPVRYFLSHWRYHSYRLRG